MSAPPALDRELRRLLRHGTFAEVLDHALNTRRLSLERVQHHLAEQGVRVSRAALSYWRHGRSRPERAESLRAVQALEKVLDLPPASLVTLLGPQRSRTRPPDTVDRRRMWPAHSPLLTALDAPPDTQLRRLAIHEHVLVGPTHTLTRVHTRLVLEATEDHVDRCLIYLWNEDAPLPTLTDVQYCRTGRTRRNAEAGALVTELVLDQRLNTGDRTVIDYTWTFPPGSPLTFYHRRLTTPVRELVLQLQFTEDVPAGCTPYRQATVDSPKRVGSPLWIGASGTAHLILTDLPPGVVGLSWEWD
ncbi:transcriptional regulator [Actinokineospora inagensis]|uniref:transcriptional regulator n=1 Tax=Actinokineospora inagensis TaxID=103730 RepID=UPI0003F93B75|nr:transcriptional regulator [Actinokineospora inagensis]